MISANKLNSNISFTSLKTIRLQLTLNNLSCFSVDLLVDPGNGGKEELLSHGGFLEPGVQLGGNFARRHEHGGLPADNDLTEAL